VSLVLDVNDGRSYGVTVLNCTRCCAVRHGAAVYALLCGGDKSSQRRDIAKAKRLAMELKESG
jgi:putative component of toxin-antitoxin plasmid stabilization module